VLYNLTNHPNRLLTFKYGRSSFYSGSRILHFLYSSLSFTSSFSSFLIISVSLGALSSFLYSSSKWDCESEFISLTSSVMFTKLSQELEDECSKLPFLFEFLLFWLLKLIPLPLRSTDLREKNWSEALEFISFEA
jgi:hypothetical protein